MRECLKIISQCIDWLLVNKEDTVSQVKQPLLKVPEGEYISNVEAPRGICSCYVKSDGSGSPYRVKMAYRIIFMLYRPCQSYWKMLFTPI